MITTQIHGKTFVIDGQNLFTAYEERELEAWLEGMTAQDAARAHNVSPETAKWHRKSIREKTHQHSSAGVLSYCFAHQYVRVLVVALIVVSAMPMARTLRSTRTPTTRVVQSQRIGRRETTREIGGLS